MEDQLYALFYTILYKRFEHSQLGVSVRILEPIFMDTKRQM